MCDIFVTKKLFFLWFYDNTTSQCLLTSSKKYTLITLDAIGVVNNILLKEVYEKTIFNNVVNNIDTFCCFS